MTGRAPRKLSGLRDYALIYRVSSRSELDRRGIHEPRRPASRRIRRWERWRSGCQLPCRRIAVRLIELEVPVEEGNRP